MKKLVGITLVGLLCAAVGCGPSAQSGNTQSAPPKAGDPAAQPGGTPPPAGGEPAAPGAAPAAATP